MAGPITGPFTTGYDIVRWSDEFNGIGTVLRMSRKWYRQKPPYDRSLEFNFSEEAYSMNGDIAPYIGVFPVTTEVLQARSRAWGRLMSAKGEGIELGTSLAEWRQSRSMFSARAASLLAFARHAKSLKFGQAIEDLRLSPLSQKSYKFSKTIDRLGRLKRLKEFRVDKYRSNRDVASFWLETHFGWAPLVKDLYDGLKPMMNDVGPQSIKGRASAGGTVINTFPPPQFGRAVVQTLSYTVTYRADIVISNPNVALANSYGLLDPLALLVEVTPWSFVADWFTNFSQVLGLWSDFLGLSVSNSTTTEFARQSKFAAWGPGVESHPTCAGSRVSCDRGLGLKEPTFFVKPFHGFSIERGATAISLLVQQLPRK